DLFDRLGVGPGSRVMVLAENCNAAVASVFAASRRHASVIPINARQTSSEVERIVGHADPELILFTSEVSAEARAHAERLSARQVSGAFGTLHLLDRSADPDVESDVAVQLYTTGTTGTPKGVMLTHTNVRFGGKTSAHLRGMQQSDIIYGVLPMTHVFGLCSIVIAATLIGAPVRLEARFDVAKLYKALGEGVTLLSAVPQMHALLMQYTKEQGYERLENSALRYVSSGAAPLDPAWKRKAEAFYGVAIQNGYGLTETTAGVAATSNTIGDPDISVGPAMDGVELRIDESAPGGGVGTGEVLARGPNIMKGYFRNPEETAKVLQPDGWLRTGDLGRIDEKGHLHILGRSKELIIHGGFNVYPPEVEAALNDHPQVIQAAVIGHMVDGDEKVLAFCQVAEGDEPTVDDLRAFAASRLAGYKRPSRIILATALPAAPTGKILKHKLAAHFAEELKVPLSK
ncbi:MAG: class I adenylate-forming enzyme family protein, partial [Pseudomonadota bacterium]